VNDAASRRCSRDNAAARESSRHVTHGFLHGTSPDELLVFGKALKKKPTSENIGSFLAKSTTRVMAGVMILVNSLKASRSTLSPSDVGTTGPWPMSSDCKQTHHNQRGPRHLLSVSPKHFDVNS